MALETKEFLYQKDKLIIADSKTKETCLLPYDDFEFLLSKYKNRNKALQMYADRIRITFRQGFSGIEEGELYSLVGTVINWIEAKF